MPRKIFQQKFHRKINGPFTLPEIDTENKYTEPNGNYVLPSVSVHYEHIPIIL